MIYLSPLEHFITYTVFAQITNFMLYTALALMIVGHFMIFNSLGVRLSNVVNVSNLLFNGAIDSLITMINGTIGISGERYAILIVQMFLIIVVINLVGLTPYAYTPSSNLCFTIFLSVTVMISCTILSLYYHGVQFFAIFVPEGTPILLVPLLILIETVSYLARAFSLGIRLGANIIAGHSLLAIISGFVYLLLTHSPAMLLVSPLAIALVYALFIMEFGVAILQAYVFTLLSISYIHDALRIH